MERQLTINMQQTVGQRLKERIRKMTEKLNMPVRRLGDYYSMVLERDINSRQTWALLEAQAALFLGILPVGYAFTIRLIALLWLVLAVKRCKELL